VDEGRARLESAEIGWITTVTSSGRPQSSPVWFVWDGEAVHIATRPAAPKVRNARANHHVAFHVDGAAPGDIVVSLEGTAEVREQLDASDAYVAKYEGGMDRLGITPGDYLTEFSSALRITPVRWRVFVSE
jgi:PPOX class probable F420-dependent enzyme